MRYSVTFILFFLLIVSNATAQKRPESKEQSDFYANIPKANLPLKSPTLSEKTTSAALNIQALKLQSIGYEYVDKSKSAVGAISTLHLNQQNISGYSNLAEYMQGRIAGVTITKDSSSPYGYNIHIRGVNSLVLSSDPLLVVNGTPMSSLSIIGELSPNNVKSIDVLKGPAAAIYGSRGANGVIVIDTK